MSRPDHLKARAIGDRQVEQMTVERQYGTHLAALRALFDVLGEEERI